MSRSVRGTPFRLAVAVCLALAANFFVAGSPALHAAAHALHDDHPHEHSADAGHGASHEHGADADHRTDDGHHEVHPSSLHDDGALPRPLVPHFFLLAAVSPSAVEAAAQTRAPAARPTTSLRSRAPPPGDPARAPPLA